MKLQQLNTLCMAAIVSSASAFTSLPNNSNEMQLARIHQVTRSKMLMMAAAKEGKSEMCTNDANSDRRNFLQTGVACAGSIFLSMSTPALAEDALQTGGKIRFGDEKIMAPKEHGTTASPVQEDLRYGVSRKTADKICSFNRRFAEYSTYFQGTSFEKTLMTAKENNQLPLTFYDSVTGQALFQAPIGRSAEEFLEESRYHGWPSFRDQEVVWDNVRVLKNSGETVSLAGTHLGHNIPDKAGNRYCINLVSISGNPVA